MIVSFWKGNNYWDLGPATILWNECFIDITIIIIIIIIIIMIIIIIILLLLLLLLLLLGLLHPNIIIIVGD